MTFQSGCNSWKVHQQARLLVENGSKRSPPNTFEAESPVLGWCSGGWRSKASEEACACCWRIGDELEVALVHSLRIRAYRARGRTGPSTELRRGSGPEPNPAQILWVEGFLGKDGEGQRRRSVAREACRSVGANGLAARGSRLGEISATRPRHDPWDWHIHRSQTLHGTGIYAYIDPPGTTPGLIGIYGSPMECLGIPFETGDSPALRDVRATSGFPFTCRSFSCAQAAKGRKLRLRKKPVRLVEVFVCVISFWGGESL